MKRISLQCAQQVVFVGPIAALLLISIAPTRAQTSAYEFNDSHFHRAPTYYLHTDAPLYYYSFTDARGLRRHTPAYLFSVPPKDG
jgi:hypothetical protein